MYKVQSVDSRHIYIYTYIYIYTHIYTYIYIVNGHWEAFCLSSSVQVPPLDVTTPRDSYVRNYRELATLLIPSESRTEDELNQLPVGSMSKNRTTEHHLLEPHATLAQFAMEQGMSQLLPWQRFSFHGTSWTEINFRLSSCKSMDWITVRALTRISKTKELLSAWRLLLASSMGIWNESPRPEERYQRRE